MMPLFVWLSSDRCGDVVAGTALVWLLLYLFT